jgi:hypothetical protein
MSEVRKRLRNVVLGLGLAAGIAGAVSPVSAFSCKVVVGCSGGGYVYCYCENGSSGSCVELSNGCGWTCDDSFGTVGC